MADFDYREKTQREGVEMVVRPGMKYGKAVAGQTVRIDEGEYERGPTRDTLYPASEHAQAVAAKAAAREAAAAPKTNQVGASILAQLDRMWKDAEAKAPSE